MVRYSVSHDLRAPVRGDRQDRAWRDAVLAGALPRIDVEAGVTHGWGQYGCYATLGLDRFGESGPGAQLSEHFGLIAARLADLVQTHCDAGRHLLRSSH